MDSRDSGAQPHGAGFLPAGKHQHAQRCHRDRQHLPPRARRDRGSAEIAGRAIWQPLSAGHWGVPQAIRGGRPRAHLPAARGHHVTVPGPDGGGTLSSGAARRSPAHSHRGPGPEDARSRPGQVRRRSSVFRVSGPHGHGPRDPPTRRWPPCFRRRKGARRLAISRR